MMFIKCKGVERIYYKFMVVVMLFRRINTQYEDLTLPSPKEEEEITPKSYFADIIMKQENMFQEFIDKYYFDYNGVDTDDIRKVFRSNLVYLDYLQVKGGTAKFGINRYTGLTFENFTKSYTGFNGADLTDDGVELFDPKGFTRAPPVMDWTDTLHRYRQFYCRNSYVFSALSTIESRFFAWMGNSYELSPRQAFECEESGSCVHGGVPHKVFRALHNTGGVSLRESYPEFPENNNRIKNECATKNNTVEILITGFTRFKVKNEDHLIYLLARHGPVATTIYASESLKNYKEGIWDPDDCYANSSNHAVLLAGYGYDKNLKQPFWSILNSWGDDWGENGFFRLIRGKQKFACNFGREYIASVTVEPHKEYWAGKINRPRPPRDYYPQRKFVQKYSNVSKSMNVSTEEELRETTRVT